MMINLDGRGQVFCVVCMWLHELNATELNAKNLRHNREADFCIGFAIMLQIIVITAKINDTTANSRHNTK